MKKRNIALVMAGLMAAMSLTGCSGGAQEEASADGAAKTEAAGSEAADGGEKSLTVAWWGNQVRNERTGCFCLGCSISRSLFLRSS